MWAADASCDACGLRWLPFRTIGAGNGLKLNCPSMAIKRMDLLFRTEGAQEPDRDGYQGDAGP